MMKPIILLLALGGFFSTAHAQTAPAKPQLPAAAAQRVVTANGKAIGHRFITKSKPYDSPAPKLPPVKK